MVQERRRAFVISPIGLEGTAAREHANDVFDYIIKPAMDACEIEVVRSDHLKEPGTISAQMFREILEDDLCLALLTGYNPNVFYELAIAQAAARPVIILIERGQALPFDIQDLRCVQYDLKPRSLFEKTYVQEIVNFVRELERVGWRCDTPFGGITPLGAERVEAPGPRFLGGLDDFGGPDAWMALLDETEHVFEAMGATLAYWTKAKRFADVLVRKTASGCRIRLLMLSRDSPGLADQISLTLAGASYEKFLVSIDEMAQFFARLVEREPKIEVRQIRHGTLYCTSARTDKSAIFAPRLYAERTHLQPAWIALSGSVLYDKIAGEFDGLWEANPAR